MSGEDADIDRGGPSSIEDLGGTAQAYRAQLRYCMGRVVVVSSSEMSVKYEEAIGEDFAIVAMVAFRRVAKALYAPGRIGVISYL